MIIEQLFVYKYFVLLFVDLLIMLINLYVGRPNFFGKSKALFCVGKTFFLIFVFLQYKQFHDYDYFYLYLLLHWIGDLLLLSREYIFMLFGCGSFFGGHALLIYKSEIPYTQYDGFVLVLTIPWLIFAIFAIVRKSLAKPLYYGIGVYGILLVISLYVSAQKSILYSYSDPRFYLEYLGKVSFLVSDYLLIKDEIPGKADYSTNMNNWPLYILAQFLITLSRIFPEEMIF